MTTVIAKVASPFAGAPIAEFPACANAATAQANAVVEPLADHDPRGGGNVGLRVPRLAFAAPLP